MKYTEKIAKLLRTPEEVILSLEKKMEKITGKKDVLKKLAQEIDGKIEETLSRLKFDYYTDKPVAQQVFNALIEQARETDSKLFEHFQKPSSSTEAGCKVLINAVRELTGGLKGFYLKEEKAKELLKLNPPKNILAALGYGTSIEKMLEKEDVFEIFSALRFAEDSKWLNSTFFKPYKDLTKDDFEEREIKTMVLPQRWLDIGRKFLGKKLHHMSHLKELGVVFIIPVEEQVPGEILYLFFMTLHYIYEVDWHSHLFEKYSREEDFAKKMINTLKVEVSGKKLPNAEKMSWRVISKYLAKGDSNDPRLFEPHINTEAWHYYKANQAIEQFSKRFPELGLDFWIGLDVVGEYFPFNHNGKDVLISFDLFDTAIALLQQIGFESKYLYHQQEALWTDIFMRYMGEEKTDQVFKENISKGHIVL
jgi:hypothetical protein